VSLASIASLLSLLSHLSASLPTLSTPFLVQHGLRDLLCSPHGTRVLLQSSSLLSAFDKRLVVHSRSWHDLLHEAEGERAVELCMDWMEQRRQHRDQTQSLD
jgi:hypothetical protein